MGNKFWRHSWSVQLLRPMNGQGMEIWGSGGEVPRKIFNDKPFTFALNVSPDPMFAVPEKGSLTICNNVCMN